MRAFGIFVIQYYIDLAVADNRKPGKPLAPALRDDLAQTHKRHCQRRYCPTDLLRIGERCAATLIAKRIDHGQLLYDEAGLPK